MRLGVQQIRGLVKSLELLAVSARAWRMSGPVHGRFHAIAYILNGNTGLEASIPLLDGAACVADPEDVYSLPDSLITRHCSCAVTSSSDNS